MTPTLGIVGGGQLAAMLTDACSKAGVPCVVLEPSQQCPAVVSGASWIEGDSWDLGALTRLAEASDILTVEIENVSTENLAAIEATGKTIVPNVNTLALLVDKFKQKKTLANAGIATSSFKSAPVGEPIEVTELGLPIVWKASRGGYDGRGVQIIRSGDTDFVPETDGYLETFVDAQMEIAVMVAATKEDIVTWAPVEMEFDEKTNILKHLISPARITPELAKHATDVAVQAIHAVKGQGIFGVEMFVTDDNQILVNEIAPRAHNSGHVTMDSSKTSQFEQQLRILIDQPLGATDLTSPAVMGNVLGADGYSGNTVIENLEEVQGIADAHVHLYGKHQCFSQRKMGHVTTTAGNINDAVKIMNQVQSLLIVRGETKDA